MRRHPCNLILIGASTGGTRILPQILDRLPPLRAAILIVQHLPEYATASFVRTLGRHSSMPVEVVAPGARLAEGHVFVAPGGRHCLLSDNSQLLLDDGPRVNFVRPSVDVTMLSVAAAPKPRRLCGVILTGMGRDGAEGVVYLKRMGAVTIAQDEASCAVFGMPKMAIATGSVDHVLAPDAIAEALVRLFH